MLDSPPSAKSTAFGTATEAHRARTELNYD
jgi:hypothetical protein